MPPTGASPCTPDWGTSVDPLIYTPQMKVPGAPTAVAVNTCLGRDTTVVEHQMHSFCFLLNVAGVY